MLGEALPAGPDSSLARPTGIAGHGLCTPGACGAVTAALNWKDVKEPLKGLLSRISLKEGSTDLEENVRFNLVSVAKDIVPYIKEWGITDRNVEVVPAFYSFSTGKVEVLGELLIK